MFHIQWLTVFFVKQAAPCLTYELDVAGKKVGVILSGGNVDFSRFFEGLR